MDLPDFRFSNLTFKQEKLAANVRTAGQYMATVFDEACEDCPAKNLAMTNLEQAVMWAVKAVAECPAVTEGELKEMEEQIPLLTDREPKVEEELKGNETHISQEEEKEKGK